MENFIFCAVGIDCGIAKLQLRIPSRCLSGFKMPFNEQDYEKQKGPGTSYQPRFRLQILCYKKFLFRESITWAMLMI